MECSVDGCIKTVLARGWCKNHYMRWYRRQGSPAEDRRTSEFRPRSSCSVDGCDAPHYAREVCRNHYAQMRNASSEERRKRIIRRLAAHEITIEEYDVRFAEQGGACRVCGRTEPNGKAARNPLYWLAVDHDHETGEIRGLLCQNCNNGLGCFGDRPELLQAALAYLAG